MLAVSPCLWRSPSLPPPCGARAALRAARSQAGLLCGRAAVAAGRPPLAVRRPFLTSKQAAAKKIQRLWRALPWSTPCGAGLERREKFLVGVPSTKAPFGYRSSTSVRERSMTGSSACRSFACVYVRLAVQRGAVVLQSCPVVPVPLLWMAAVPHLAAVLTDFCLQGPLSPKFSAPAAGTGRGRWRSKTRFKCLAHPGQRSRR